ncbi:MAG: hemolysin secretion protein [Rhizobacter sp.]|nr:hemolysin secretion protein [Rhizobacter sp.]
MADLSNATATPMVKPTGALAPLPPRGTLQRGDEQFMKDVTASVLSHTSPASVLIMWLIAAVVVSGLAWAYFARVEEITLGEARIIPISREQVIQSLEGGIVEEMLVHEGDVVEKNQILLRIDPTRAQAGYKEGLSKVQGLKGTIARLRAEAYGLALAFPPDVQLIPSIVHDETEAFNARRRSLDESLAALRRSQVLAQKEIDLAQPLAERGLISEVEILRMRRQANEFSLQIAERQNKYRSDANQELVRLESELAQSGEVVITRQDTLRRTTIRSPLKGTVKNIRSNTIGGVVAQGADIMEIVPLEDQLLVEAKVKPHDVAFLHPGLDATVKISAYDFGIYGGLKGKVELISPDTLRDEKRQAASGQDDTYYRVIVRTTSSNLIAGGKELPIIPGMTATVEIRTGEKTVLDYLLKPVFKAREAFRER